MRTRFIAIIALFVGLLLAADASAQIRISWYTSANSYKHSFGQTFSFICPGGGRPGTIYGTYTYTTDSKICTAAVHAGKIGFSGGLVTIRIGGPRQSFTGTFKRGVSSRRWGFYKWSYRFVGGRVGPPPRRGPQMLTWFSNATPYRNFIGRTYTFICPGGGRPGTVYGSGVYTTDSKICVAAVHAGKIGFSGGQVRIQITAGQRKYWGTYRNGVKTRSWNSYGWSFVFR